ncbi:MAG: N-acetyltransferase [Calditrichales bacterium]|nr:MAG: N-acetyltransferase [Calditrichales bacterium]
MPDFPPTQIRTERLFLRKPVMEDAATIYDTYASDSEVSRYLTWRPHASVTDTRKFIDRCIFTWAEGSAFPWTIIRQKDQQLLGMIEITRVDHAGVNLGYVLGRDFWGNGYMTEALTFLIKWAMSQEDVFRVWAICDAENAASARTLEKVGMEREGTLRRWLRLPRFGDTPRDCYCYAIIK